jgi:FRG domain
MTSAAAWNVIEVTTWLEFSQALEPVLVGYTLPSLYLFRGQANTEWLLEPSLLRQIRRTKNRSIALKIEQLLEYEFKAQAALFPETQNVLPVLRDEGSLEWWAYMQHHGCPTRLLDWTASAFVGAYFAVSQLPGTDGALFVVAPHALNVYNTRQHSDTPSISEEMLRNISNEMLLNPDAPERVAFFAPSLRSHRVVAQQGCFSFSSNPLSPHDQRILEACFAVAPELSLPVIQQKIVIASCLKLEILLRLRAMNVAPHALFPTLDGLGRSLADLASLQAIQL